jgi:hypothetical protein
VKFISLFAFGFDNFSKELLCDSLPARYSLSDVIGFDFLFPHEGHTRTLHPEWGVDILLQVVSVPFETIVVWETGKMVAERDDAGCALHDDELALYPFVVPTLCFEYLYFYFHHYLFLQRYYLFSKYAGFLDFTDQFFLLFLPPFGTIPAVAFMGKPTVPLDVFTRVHEYDLWVAWITRI